MQYKWNRNCKSFPGTYACNILKDENQDSCENCKFYEPIDTKILIIKLGSMGDVLRTTPLLQALKQKYPNSHITWLTKKESLPLLKNNFQIDKLLSLSNQTIFRLQEQKFDILLSLEIDCPGTAIANKIQAEKKFGYYLDKDSHPSCFNTPAEYYLEKAWSDSLNKKNQKTYQEMIFEIVELPYNNETYELQPNKELSKKFLQTLGLSEKDNLIGINIGSGKRWPSKKPSKEVIIAFTKELEKNNKIILLGGPSEETLLKNLQSELKKQSIEVLTNNPQNTLEEFISIIALCNKIITTDSLALHIAIALKKPTLALFYCTLPQEIETYGFTKTLTSPLLEKNFFTNLYNKELANSISPDKIIQAFKELN